MKGLPSLFVVKNSTYPRRRRQNSHARCYAQPCRGQSATTGAVLERVEWVAIVKRESDSRSFTTRARHRWRANERRGRWHAATGHAAGARTLELVKVAVEEELDAALRGVHLLARANLGHHLAAR